MTCSLYITVPTRPLGLPEAKEVFDIAATLDNGYYSIPPTFLSF